MSRVRSAQPSCVSVCVCVYVGTIRSYFAQGQLVTTRRGDPVTLRVTCVHMSRGGGRLARGASLSSVEPTKEELLEAEEIVKRAKSGSKADADKGQRRLMASMSHWLKANSDQNIDAIESRGEARRQFLLKHLVLMAREKSALRSTVSRTIGTEKLSHAFQGWISYEQLKTKVGEYKADKWIEQKVIESKPDPKTGAEEKEMREYFYDEDYQTQVTGDGVRYEMSGDGFEGQLAQDMMGSMDGGDGGGKGSGSHDDPEIKKEPLTAAEKLETNPRPTLTKFQNLSTDLKVMANTASGQRYADEFLNDCKKLAPKIAKCVKALEAMTTGVKGRDWQPDHTCKFMEGMQSVEDTYAELHDFAQQRGWIKNKRARTRGWAKAEKACM